MSMKKLAARLFGLIVMLGAGAGALAQGNAEDGAGKVDLCVACHGQTGNDSTLPNVPRLGGQNAKYLLKQLIDIKTDARVVPEMTGMLTNFDELDLADIAAYYAEQPAAQSAADPELRELGESIYRAGIPEIGVAACSACHAPTGEGNAPAGYPALSGQLTAYAEKQLRDFRAGARTNDDQGIMRALARRMSDEEIAAVASYAAGLRVSLQQASND